MKTLTRQMARPESADINQTRQVPQEPQDPLFFPERLQPHGPCACANARVPEHRRARAAPAPTHYAALPCGVWQNTNPQKPARFAPTSDQASTRRPCVGPDPERAHAADGRPTAPHPRGILLGKTAIQDVVGGASATTTTRQARRLSHFNAVTHVRSPTRGSHASEDKDDAKKDDDGRTKREGATRGPKFSSVAAVPANPPNLALTPRMASGRKNRRLHAARSSLVRGACPCRCCATRPTHPIVVRSADLLR